MLSDLKYRLLQRLPWSPVIVNASRKIPTLYLTFDDGPFSEHTENLLSLLQQHDINASFFCIGRNIKQNPLIVQRIADEGHLIGNHSFNHSQFSALSLKKQFIEVEMTNAALSDITGEECSFFRFPKGRLSVGLLLKLWQRSTRIIHWSYDSHDYKSSSAEMIVERLTKKPVKNGDILLFHDDNSMSVAALDQLIPIWKSSGFNFSRVSDI